MALHVKLWAFLLVAWTLGIIAASYGHPVLYCYGWQPMWRGFIQPYSSLALFISGIYLLYALASYGIASMEAVGAFLLIFLIGNLDGWARALLALGKPC
ncbi:hypothetical protein [Bradyrhizobium sp. SYSU BS000235]|uniref:hypothetical protein n=1 Tax=Bradyrhizobium sp. SYSU BS000235 TaxID=3411332 RepID=UPI003C78F5A9